MLAGFRRITDIDILVSTIIKEVKKLTGIQIRVGVAPTKTLAKVAIHLAKGKPENYYLIPTDEEEKLKALKQLKIEDMWNVGRQYAAMLYRNGIYNAARLSVTPDWWIRKKMTVIGWRTLQELRGIPCLQIVEMMDRKKKIGVGRSFKKATANEQELIDAATFYSVRLSEKLREEKLLTTVLQIKLRTNKWKVDTAQHQPCKTYHLSKGISNVIDITAYAKDAVRKIVEANKQAGASYKYMKFEISASVLIPENENQLVINDRYDSGVKNKLSTTIDNINMQLGKGKVCFANNLNAWRKDNRESYIMRQNYPSPNYFTDWNEAPLLK